MENTEPQAPVRRGRPPRNREIDLSADTAVIDATGEPGEPGEVVKPAFDPSGDVELRHVAMPYMPMNGAQGISVDGHFASGYQVSGIVRRLVLQTNGVIRAVVELNAGNPHMKTEKFAFLYFRDWTYVEPRHDFYQDIDERTALGT